MNPHYTYLFILIGALAGPLLLSFDKKVAFYKKWKAFGKAMIMPAMFYIVWDVVFTQRGIWSFNENYITGIKIINLPIEEVLFFFIVPYCCVFIVSCIETYFPSVTSGPAIDFVFKILGVLLAVAAMYYHDRAYTFFTFFFTSIFIFIISSKKYFTAFNTSNFLVSYAVILIPFLIVNGLLTSIPVVLYNDNENMGYRIYTIPFEDIFYGMLLVMMNVAGYEKLKNK